MIVKYILIVCWHYHQGFSLCAWTFVNQQATKGEACLDLMTKGKFSTGENSAVAYARECSTYVANRTVRYRTQAMALDESVQTIKRPQSNMMIISAAN